MSHNPHNMHAAHNHQHDHVHADGSMHIHPVVKNMRMALVLNLVFTCIEFAGGLLTNSIAILSDAIHDLGDSIAIGAALLLEKHSHKGRSQQFTYGKRRLSTLAALITSMVLVSGSIVILFNAIPRFWHTQQVNVNGVLWLSVLGILFNGLALLRLRTSNKDSLNQRSVMLHLMEDVLGWIAVLAGGILMYFTRWYWIDPLLSLGIAVFIFFNAIRNIRTSLKILLQSVPVAFNEQAVRNALTSLPQVKEIHDVHCWTMDGEYHIFTAHMVVDTNVPPSQWQQLQQQALRVLQGFHIQHTTLQLESQTMPCTLKHC